MSAAAASQAMNTLNIVSTQIQNLLNVHVTKIINTGDRVVDNGITIIVNSCIALIGAYLYTLIIKISNYIYNCYVLKHKPETDNPTDIDIAKFDYSNWDTAKISTYLINCPIQTYTIVNDQITYTHLHDWMTATFTTINYVKQKQYYPANGIVQDSSCISGCFMPIWKYKNKVGEFDYVWVSDDNIYSNDYNALDQCLKAIYAFNKARAPVSKQVIEQKICYIYELDLVGNNIKVGKMNPKKSFNSLFYDKKDELIHVLDKFITETMYPVGMCDNKLGILLYGPPGTGKTGTITALANYTQRDIVMVKNTTRADLDNLKKFLKDRKLKDYIIVFDEFDHILCGKPKEGTDYKKEYKIRQLREELLREELRDLPEDDKEERKRIQQEIKDLRENKEDDKTAEIGMGDLLKFLDGVEDQSERLIIATTNYPDKINPLLLRPGRFDLKLELGYCSMQMFCDIAGKIFPDAVERLDELIYLQTIGAEATAEDLKATTIEITHTRAIPMKTYIATLLEKRITPLNLINSCLKSKSFNDMIAEIESLPPDTFTYSTTNINK